MDTGRFVVYIKTQGIYGDIEKDLEARFDTSNYELDRPWPKRKKEKGIELMKDELGEKIMERSATLRAESKNIQFFLPAATMKIKKYKVQKMFHKNCLDKNYNIFQTTRFNHTMIFFKLTD